MLSLQKIDETLPIIEDWLSSQPHLPKISTIVLKHFINVCDGNIEEVQKLIEFQYGVRVNYPNIFLERDPSSHGSQVILKATDILYLPGHSSENYKVLFFRLRDMDPNKYLFVDSIKVSAMIYDILVATPDPVRIIDGLISIYDMNGYTLKHLSKVNFTALRAFLKFFEKSISLKLRQIHVINCPSYLDKVLAILKPFISTEIYKMIKFHQPNTDTLFDYVSKDLIPVEYGGNNGSVDDIKKEMLKAIDLNKDYLMDKSFWNIDEKKRPAGNKTKKSQDMNGAFQNLTLD